ncbi:MAG TPA: 6-carboxytetrahydropterin synthase [Pseudobdellovibrionaceae bacterium]|nr:6-carboxytetrahydropterin synthase [Pseudobdellovibrionaceae bacterium]
MKTFIELSDSFSSAHLYHQPKWDQKRNDEEFGRCHTAHGHGHNYRVLVEFEAPNSLRTLEEAEQRPELEVLRKSLREETRRLDHEHLNFVIPEFKDVVPTTENIARVLMERLHARKLPWAPARLRLYEMDDLWVEVLA